MLDFNYNPIIFIVNTQNGDQSLVCAAPAAVGLDSAFPICGTVNGKLSGAIGDKQTGENG